MEKEIKSKILRIISENQIHLGDVASGIGCTIQTLSYQLNHSRRTDKELIDKIIGFCHKKGFIKSTNELEQCNMVSDLTLEFTSLITQEISILTNEVRSSIKDGKITDSEKTQLLNRVRHMREDVSSELDLLESLIRE